MSEAELHILKARMRGGQINKALRGELEMGPPVGLIYRTDGTIGLDPEVQSALRMVFDTFERTAAPSKRFATSASKASNSHAGYERGPARVTSCGRLRSIHASCRCCTIRATLVPSSMAARAPAIGPMAGARCRGRQGGLAVRDAGHAPGPNRLGTVRSQSAAPYRQCRCIRWRTAVGASGRGTAMFKASSTSRVARVVAIDQPTIRRLDASGTTAR
jgi:hypothetical protein